MMKICLIFSLTFAVLVGKDKQPLCFSDNGIVPAHCEQIAKDEERFANFKREPLLTLFMENATEEEGWSCLPHISQALLEKCRCNDLVGNPKRVSYGKRGDFSPTTLRFAKIATDLEKEFGSLEGKRIVEIGGGYGGLCTILSALFSFESYTFIDLPQHEELCRRYLQKQKVEKTAFSVLSRLPEQETDLVISHFAFSEMDRSLQKQMISKVLSRAKAGFLICSPAHWKEIPYSATEHKRVKPLPREKILDELKKQGIDAWWCSEDPLTGKDHYVIIWKRGYPASEETMNDE